MRERKETRRERERASDGERGKKERVKEIEIKR